MSAYIVGSETIDRVLSYIDMEEHRLVSQLELACGVGYKPTQPAHERFVVLGQAMWDLNARAVEGRYPHQGPAVAPGYAYRFRPCDQMQTYKSLQCFLYQCNEEDCDKDPLFIALAAVLHRWAEEIISRLPAYDAAEWG